MRRLLTQLTAVLFVLTLLSPASVAAEEGFMKDEHGHAYRVSFDRYNRLEFGAGFGSSTRLSGRYRTAFSLDFPDEEIWWRMRHDLGQIEFQTEPGQPWGARAVLIDADYLRHDVSSWILIPGDQDLRLPGPFDIVVRWELLGATVSMDSPDTVELWEVAEFDVLLDFIRDPAYRHRLAIGFTADYEIERGPIHHIVPMSSATALYAWEADDGLFAASTELNYARMVSLDADAVPTWSHRGRATLDLEWTVLALNDQPLALFASGRAQQQTNNAFEWSALFGARFSIQGEE